VTDRVDRLSGLAKGDIFHAASPNGASLICLVLAITKSTIEARTVTTQCHFVFDRRTGIAEWGADRVPCTIDSVAPLPPDIHRVMLEIDLKFRPGKGLDDYKLTATEKHALLFVDGHYASNRL